MGIISEVKCGRCDRYYSGLRGRCPYCGARRSRRGKRTSEDDNSVLKLVIGVLLLLVLIAAVLILIFSTLRDGGGGSGSGGSDPDDQSSSVSTVNGGTLTPDDTTGSDDPGTVPDDTPPEPPEIIISVESIRITYGGGTVTDFTMDVGEVLVLKTATVPADAESEVTWTSSDENIFVVTQEGRVTAVGRGTGTLTVECDGATAESIVRVR